MRVHHLNCATMCPPLAGPLLGDPRGMVAHVLAIETNDGVVLVDTGFGLDDVRDAVGRLGRSFVMTTRPALSEAETAIRQLERLGFSASDVRHVLPTHLDLDHAGGLPDFPKAKVHLFAPEIDAALARAHWKEKERYRPAHFAHGPDFVRHEVGGEPWFGFDCVRDVPGLPPEILIVPLVGHTRGHAAIAVDAGKGWLVHAGDAYFHRDEMHPDGARCPVGLRVFQSTMGIDDHARVRNRERLRLLAKERRADMTVFCAHDRTELERLQSASA